MTNLVLGALMAISLRAGAGADGTAAAGPFSVDVVKDAAAASDIVVLRAQDAAHPRRQLEARVSAAAGANLFSFKVGGQELLVQPDNLAKLAQGQAGTMILFPTPNRVRGSVFGFEGRSFALPTNGGKNFIHGLVRRRPWQMGATGATGAGASAELFIDWDPAQPEFPNFPIKSRLTVTFVLGKQGLHIAFAVQNKDSTTLPFGFALHPFFRVPGKREDVLLQVPVPEHMESVEVMPTGKVDQVAGTRFDMRKPTPLPALDLDDVYLGLTPKTIPAFELRDMGLRVTLGGSPEFTHLVVYTPPTKPFFCMENQTCSTDAHNLHARGLKKEAHLLVAAPGKTIRGYADWRIEWLPAADR